MLSVGYGLGSGHRSSVGLGGERGSRRKRIGSDDGSMSGVGWSGGGDSGDGGDGVNRQRGVGGTGGLGRGWDGLDGSDMLGRGKGSGIERRLSSASGRRLVSLISVLYSELYSTLSIYTICIELCLNLYSLAVW